MRTHLMQCIAICALFAHSAQAAEKQSPIAAFGLETAQAQRVCHGEASHAIVQISIAKLKKETFDADTPIAECTSHARDNAKPLLQKALASAAKKPAAVKAIKDYYVAWIASLAGLSIDPNDSPRAWDERQSAAERRNNEMWSRVELEMDL